MEATYKKVAPKGVQVSVTGRFESIKEAQKHPKTSGTVVIFVLGKEAGRKGGLGPRLIENHSGKKLGAQQKAQVQGRVDEGRGAAIVGGNVGVASAENALTDTEVDVEQASDFGAALINHEIGHALGLRDTRDNHMMDDRLGASETPTPPNSHDRKKLADELKKLQGSVKH